MKNKKTLLLFLFLIFPLNVFAKENKISIECDKSLLKNNEETICKIIAENFNFIITSVSGKIKLSSNLELINSNYDDKKWKILDNRFDVKDINLISETKNQDQNYTIATFKIKAVNIKETTEEINFIDVNLGDEYYENRNILVDVKEINLKYDEQNEEINTNTLTKDKNLIIIIICITLLLGCYIFLIRKKKEN